MRDVDTVDKLGYACIRSVNVLATFVQGAFHHTSHAAHHFLRSLEVHLMHALHLLLHVTLHLLP